MKRLIVFALMSVSAGAIAQTLPFELEANRKPQTVTHGSVLIQGGRILTGTHGNLENMDVLIVNGKIAKVGRGLKAPSGVTVINATGKVVAPGIVDGHSHRAADGTNEGADSITAEVRMADVLNTSALSVWQALASGHTTALILHGSANCIGGQSVVIKYKYQRPSSEAIVADAPRMIKFALGENVTRKSDGNTARFPRTRMGQEAVFRRGFTDAKSYMAAWDAYTARKTTKPPRRDLRLETLADILRGKIWVQCHSYRSDEILMMVRLSQEFGFKIGAMQHALESYKVAPELAKAGVGVSIFEDSWSFKAEGYDSIPFAAAINMRAGVNVSINTDGVSGTTALNIDAAKTMRYGGLTEQQALQTITINPAKELGVDHRTGSIDVGKDGDVVIWDGHPLSVYSKCAMTLIEGEVFFERHDAFGVDARSMVKTVLDKKVFYGEQAIPAHSRSYAIVDATIHPVSSPVIERGTVVIRDGKISAVGAQVAIPSDCREINGRGMHVYPGFIDGYSTIGLREIGPVNAMIDDNELGQTQADLDAQSAIWVESAHFGPARYNGVTNAFTGPAAGQISGQGAVINTDGYTTEQFGVKRKAALIVNMAGGFGRSFEFDLCDGAVDASMLLGLGGDAGGRTDQLTRAQLEQYYDMLGGAQGFGQGFGDPGPSDSSVSGYFDRAIKYIATKKEKPETPIDLGLEAMIPYVKGERLVLINCRSASAVRTSVEFIKKYKLKGAICGASESWKEAKLLKDNHIPVIIFPAGKSTLSANTTDQSWDPYDTPYAAAGWLERAGVKFCFASGAGDAVMNLPVRVGQSCAYGLTQEGAIKALTQSAAEIFGVQDKLGTLEVGKMANLVVTDGDPFELTSNYRYVFIDGQPRPLVSKHTLLRDKYMNRK